MEPKIAFLFPGQGSQKEGMGEGIINTDSFRHIESFIPGIREILTSGKEKIDEEAAKAISSVSTASALELIKGGIKPHYLAGFSLGEISALIISGILSEKEGFELLDIRTESMKEDCRTHDGVMYAVNGLPAEKVEEITSAYKNVWPVNYNSPLQTVISGERENTEKAAGELKSLGAKPIKLGVKGAFHSEYMENTERKLKDYLENVKLREAVYTPLSNVTGDVYPADDEEIRELISSQVKNPVQFTKMAENLKRLGVNVFIEVGYGKTMVSLIKRILGDCVKIFTVSSPEDALKVKEALFNL